MDSFFGDMLNKVFEELKNEQQSNVSKTEIPEHPHTRNYKPEQRYNTTNETYPTRHVVPCSFPVAAFKPRQYDPTTNNMSPRTVSTPTSNKNQTQQSPFSALYNNLFGGYELNNPIVDNLGHPGENKEQTQNRLNYQFQKPYSHNTDVNSKQDTPNKACIDQINSDNEKSYDAPQHMFMKTKKPELPLAKQLKEKLFNDEFNRVYNNIYNTLMGGNISVHMEITGSEIQDVNNKIIEILVERGYNAEVTNLSGVQTISIYIFDKKYTNDLLNYESC